MADAAGAIERHKVGVLGAAGLVAGGMIGSGVFLLPATLATVGSVSILGWIAATAVAMSLAAVFIFLGPLAPKAEGIAEYVSAGLGRFFGVQATVLYWASIWVGLVPVALAAAGSIGFLVPALAGPAPRLVVTIAVIWLGVGVAWAGPRMVARAEALTLAMGLLPVILAATAGWFVFQPEVFHASWNPGALPLGEAVRTSALSCFWAFLGLECAATAAGVVRDPLRNVPRATLLGVLGTAAVYIAASAAVMGVLPAGELAKSQSPFGDVARAALGSGFGAAIAVCVVLRCAGCLTGWNVVVAETTRCAADGGMFPALFRTRPGERVPTVSMLTAGGLMTVVALLTASPDLAQQFSTLINTVSLICLYSYILAAASLLRLSGGLAQAQRAMAVTAALVGTGGALVLIASARPVELLASLGFVAAAALLHLWLRRR